MKYPVVAQYVVFQKGTKSRLEVEMGMGFVSNLPSSFYEYPCGSCDTVGAYRFGHAQEDTFYSEGIAPLVVE